MAFIFLAYVDSVITSTELRRLVLAIDLAFSDDLSKLLDAPSLSVRSVDAWLEYLVPSGLARQVSGETLADFGDDIGKRYFELTSLANKLRNAYFHGKKAANA